MGWRDRAIPVQPASTNDWRTRAIPVEMPHAPTPIAPDPGEKTTTEESALQGFGQGGTLGYLPEIQAGAGAIGQKAIETLGGPEADTYQQLKDYFQKRNQTMRTEHPVATSVGNIAGAVMTLPIGGSAKGAGFLARAARAAGTGAAYGGLANPETEATPQDPYANLKARLANAGIGAGLGFGGEALIGGTGQAIEKAGERFAGKAVVKQIGANAGQIKKILQKDELPKIETFIRDEKLMRPGKSLEDVADHTKEILETDGPAIGQLYQDAQDQAKTLGIGQKNRISGPELADEILKNAREKFKSHANRDVVMKEMESAVAPLRDLGENANIVDIHNYRKSLDENINWAQKAQERDAVQNSFIDARNLVADKTKNTINALDEALGGNQLDALKKLNARYSAASTVNNISTQGVARETAKAFMGHGVIGGGVGLGAGTLEYNRSHDPLKAFGVGLGSALGVTAARKFGSPVGYYGGKAVQSLGQGIEALTPNPGAMGVGLTSPWVNMKKKEQ